VPIPSGRFKPLYPRLAAAGESLALKFTGRYFRSKDIHRAKGAFASERRRTMQDALARGETIHLAGICMGGYHNSGVALIAVDARSGPRIICNNEEERFSGRKHANHFPDAALDALADTMEREGIAPSDIHAWLGTFDLPLYVASGIRALLEEFPSSLSLLNMEPNPGFDPDNFKRSFEGPARLAQRFGLGESVPVIGMPHHDNHAYFSYLVSPFARSRKETMVIVVDGAGDQAAISFYLGSAGQLRSIRDNGSLFDSLGHFYSVISSTQGGWTILSSEGRYMGAAAFGDMRRASNSYYARLRQIFGFFPRGEVRINRTLANWHCDDMLRNPYTPALAQILGPPLAPKDMWNPDAILRVEDVQHHPHTQDRVDKAAATQLVLEDALIHIVDGFIRETGCDQLVLTGGTALNALANMRLLEHFDDRYYAETLDCDTRLHLWVPPVPGDAGAPLGAAYGFAASAGAPAGASLQHAFYCGRGPSTREMLSALKDADDLDWAVVGNTAERGGIDAIADLMAEITAKDGIIGIVQGPAETGPRALGHRSILANACNPRTRDLINERVKHREPIRPLAPMMTLRAAKALFELSDGAADDNYNAYNYMVITVQAKPQSRAKVPAVVHADGSARIQIVRETTDPVIFAYLRALGRRVGVEVAVNTSFNVGAPIAQTPLQVLETLRRARGMDGVFIFADEGPVAVAWVRQPTSGTRSRIRDRIAAWQRAKEPRVIA
jgi:carbamoyltransferase